MAFFCQEYFWTFFTCAHMKHKRYAKLSPVRSYSSLAISALGFALANPPAQNLLPFFLLQTPRKRHTEFQIPRNSIDLLGTLPIPGRRGLRSTFFVDSVPSVVNPLSA
jgi:hypothetical protein